MSEQSAMDDLDFFSSTTTLAAIDRLAHLEDVVLYAGAGVTADQTALTWSGLITQLVARKSDSFAVAEEAVRRMGPAQAGSVAEELWQSSGNAGWRLEWDAFIRSLIYPEEGAAFGGRACSELAAWWLDLQARGDVSSILTTNYDDWLEVTIEEVDSLRRADRPSQPPDDRSVDTPRRNGASVTGSSVTHLHGVLQRRAGGTAPAVVTEEDYFASRPATMRELTWRFAERSVVLVGASVTDPPLVEALLKTRGSRPPGSVLVPQADVGGHGATPELMAILLLRFQRLGLVPIVVPTYAQIAQLLAEVNLASALGPGEYQSSDLLYSRRFERWWDEWSSRCGGAFLPEQQRLHHELTCSALNLAKDTLGVPTEPLKLEVWLRWGRTGRELRLWSSSHALFAEPALNERVDLDGPDGDHPCAVAHHRGSAVWTHDRLTAWPTSLCLPIVNAEHRLPVGVVRLASRSGVDDSLIGPGRRGRVGPTSGSYLHRVAAELSDLGEQIGAPRSPSDRQR
jgi:hypothetical protein